MIPKLVISNLQQSCNIFACSKLVKALFQFFCWKSQKSCTHIPDIEIERLDTCSKFNLTTSAVPRHIESDRVGTYRTPWNKTAAGSTAGINFMRVSSLRYQISQTNIDFSIHQLIPNSNAFTRHPNFLRLKLINAPR